MSNFPLGAPSKYKPKFALELIEYFSVTPYEKRPGDRPEAGDYPSLAGFAAKIGVSRRTILNWAKEFPEFEEAFELAKDFQENWTLVNAMKGIVPPQFAQFVLINNSKYRNKAEDEAPDTVVNNVALDPKDPQFEAKWKERVDALEKKLGRK